MSSSGPPAPRVKTSSVSSSAGRAGITTSLSRRNERAWSRTYSRASASVDDLGRPAGKGPPALGVDVDGGRVVPLPVEVREHGRRRAHRHFVLARPPAEEYADPFSLHRTTILCTHPVAVRAADGVPNPESRVPSPRVPDACLPALLLPRPPDRRRRPPRRDAYRPRRRADAGVHARRHAGRGQGRDAAGTCGRSAPRSSSATPTTCGCGPATASSPGWADCTASPAGTARSSPTAADSRPSASARSA